MVPVEPGQHNIAVVVYCLLLFLLFTVVVYCLLLLFIVYCCCLLFTVVVYCLLLLLLLYSDGADKSRSQIANGSGYSRATTISPHQCLH